MQDSGLLINAVDPVSNLPQLFHLSLSDLKQTRITNDLNSYFGEVPTGTDNRSLPTAALRQNRHLGGRRCRHQIA